MQIPEDKVLKKIWAEVPPDYYFRLNYFQKLWHEWKWLVIRHLITHGRGSPAEHSRKRREKHMRILEIGCAGGHLSGLLAGVFPDAEVVGVDVYESAIEEARRRWPNLTFQVADAHRLPFKNGVFDLVMMSETIEHLVDPEKVLHEIGRVLKKDGRALVEMDSGSPLFRLVWFFWTRFGRGRVWSQAHLHPFTAGELENLITGNGFHIREKMFSHFGMAVSFLVSRKN